MNREGDISFTICQFLAQMFEFAVKFKLKADQADDLFFFD